MDRGGEKRARPYSSVGIHSARSPSIDRKKLPPQSETISQTSRPPHSSPSHVELYPAPLEDVLLSHFVPRPLKTAEHWVNFVALSFLYHTGVGTEMQSGRGSSNADDVYQVRIVTSLRRWKREDAWMTEIHPRNSMSVYRCDRGLTDGIGAVRERCPSSNASPTRTFVEYASGVVQNSLCPRSQKLVQTRQNVIPRWRSRVTARAIPSLRTLVVVCEIDYQSWVIVPVPAPTMWERKRHRSVIQANPENHLNPWQHPTPSNITSGGSSLMQGTRICGHSGDLELHKPECTKVALDVKRDTTTLCGHTQPVQGTSAHLGGILLNPNNAPPNSSGFSIPISDLKSASPSGQETNKCHRVEEYRGVFRVHRQHP